MVSTVAITATDLVNKSLKAMKQIKSARFNLKGWERIGEAHMFSEYAVKFKANPLAVYFKCYEPNKGAEILFKAGHNDNKALVKPNGFPWINLNLDPQGALIRDNSHHTISEFGFLHMHDIINDAVVRSKSQKKFNKLFSLHPPHFWAEYDCHVLKIEYPDYDFIPYTVQGKENIFDIAKKYFLSEYKILSINKSVKNYYGVEAGQEILIPNGYAKTTILYIDVKTHIPVKQEVYDDLGKYEVYEYHNLQVNAEIDEEEFSSKYHEYGF